MWILLLEITGDVVQISLRARERDTRLHADAWKQAYASLERVEKELNAKQARSRIDHYAALLAVVALLPYFVNLGSSSIWDANEAYYVETPREMIESGDYINPSFNYEPRFNKPVLSYWIVAGLYRVFGVSVGVQRAAIAGAATT